MNTAIGIVGITLVAVVTLAIGAWSLRAARSTSDFYVASRSVRPGLNASAISGEYLSAGSFLGAAALLLTFGSQMLWYPVGWTAGFLVLLVVVAAPLRRSGAYTLPDFAEARTGSLAVRRLCALQVVAIGWLYLLPQFQGAGVALHATIGCPRWVGPVIVGAVVLANVSSGGMRSVTFVQAFQYWLKLSALLIPAAVMIGAWTRDGRPAPTATPESWSLPLGGTDLIDLYVTWSLIAATILGTMGLPHVVVRYYTNPDGRAARRTTVVVLVLLGMFYVLPPIYAALGRIYAPGSNGDALVLTLPSLVVPGIAGQLLSGLVTAGAFAAFLSTSSGLAVAVAGVLSQEMPGAFATRRARNPIAAFRWGSVVAVVVPAAAALVVLDVPVARVVGLAFAVAASTFAPLLVLGIWWSRLTPAGALAGLTVGGLTSGIAAGITLSGHVSAGWPAALLGQPALWSAPAALITTMLVSLRTSVDNPEQVRRFLIRLHTPEAVALDRG